MPIYRMDDKAGIEGNRSYGSGERNGTKETDEFYPANHLKFKSYSDDYFRRGSIRSTRR